VLNNPRVAGVVPAVEVFTLNGASKARGRDKQASRAQPIELPY
jgi:hypothetical protein